MPAISATCSSRPRNEAKPLRPLNRPAPESRPNSPAPSRPPISRPPKPLPKRDGAAAGEGAAPWVTLLAPGWVIDRSIGAAGFGAVLVVGGVLNVRLPRLPPLPTRASATSIMKTIVAASASERLPKRANDM